MSALVVGGSVRHKARPDWGLGEVEAVDDTSVRVRFGEDVKTFKGFLVDVPTDTDVRDYTTVVIWCESFGQFISAAEYQASRLSRE